MDRLGKLFLNLFLFFFIIWLPLLGCHKFLAILKQQSATCVSFTFTFKNVLFPRPLGESVNFDSHTHGYSMFLAGSLKCCSSPAAVIASIRSKKDTISFISTHLTLSCVNKRLLGSAIRLLQLCCDPNLFERLAPESDRNTVDPGPFLIQCSIN